MPSDAFRFMVWPTEHRRITQHFGANPQNYAQFGLPGHEGVDLRAPSGSKIYCVAPGNVTRVHTDPHSHNYGIHVRVQHEDGYMTTYAHLQVAHVAVGDRVSAGQVLGLADNTGNSFGSHLHLTLKKEGAQFGNWPYNIIDPTPYLLPLLGWQPPVGPFLGGWVLTAAVIVVDNLAQANPDGATLYVNETTTYLIPAGTIMIVTGAARDGVTPVQVARAAVGLNGTNLPTEPGPAPPPNVATVVGWIWHEYLSGNGQHAVVSSAFGVNLRAEPAATAANIGVVRAGSTVTITGAQRDQYRPVRVRRADFTGPVQPPSPLPDEGNLTGQLFLAWVNGDFLQINGDTVLARHRGVPMRDRPDASGRYLGTIKGDAPLTIAGEVEGVYTPVLVRGEDVFNVVMPYPEVFAPEGVPTGGSVNSPLAQNRPGWILTADLAVQGDEAVVSHQGTSLRDAPHRSSTRLGLVPALATVLVTGPATGEFMPVRVDMASLLPPDAATDPGTFGRARLGLHASADPALPAAELQEFVQARAGIIKVLSFHAPDDVARLAAALPSATWIVRAFLSMNGRTISPEQFVEDTLSDVQRTLAQLTDRDVVVELHNEPNLTAEGLGSSWADGAAFAEWWLAVLAAYRSALPGQAFIYPGLSPGSSVSGLKQDHIQFVEASRAAVAAADGLGVHLYWSHIYPMSRALDVLDDYISRFRNKPIWVTEASNNKAVTPAHTKGQEYLQFWQALQYRPIVKGVTYFVASATDPAFASEVWVGRGIGQLVGRR